MTEKFKNWVDYLTDTQLYLYVEISIIGKAEIRRKILDDYGDDRDRFIQKITKPTRAKAKPISGKHPDCCGICKYYGDDASFVTDVCKKFPDWIVYRAFFEHCNDFKCDTVKLGHLTTRR